MKNATKVPCAFCAEAGTPRSFNPKGLPPHQARVHRKQWMKLLASKKGNAPLSPEAPAKRKPGRPKKTAPEPLTLTATAAADMHPFNADAGLQTLIAQYRQEENRLSAEISKRDEFMAELRRVRQRLEKLEEVATTGTIYQGAGN